mmetsp:Transcript_27395/g.38633  ORF Transcript_27395/g.38633 Transcript_27395/m.38633 type:complete len:82 (+) Transcript_27395:870-1115(+)
MRLFTLVGGMARDNLGLEYKMSESAASHQSIHLKQKISKLFELEVIIRLQSQKLESYLERDPQKNMNLEKNQQNQYGTFNL